MISARNLFLRSTLTTCVLAAGLSAQAEVTLLDHDGWRVYSNGFIEADSIYDSVRSFREVVGNSPVDVGTTANGSNPRTQFSIRNSRLAFGFEAPPADDWKTKGYLEFDLFGFAPGPGGTTSGNGGNTESGVYTSPTFRVRHAYLLAEKNGWSTLVGQTWSLLGWQPYYFLSTMEVAPVPGMLYSRTEQLRLTKTMTNGDCSLQAAAAILRPPESDGVYPDLQAGVRLASSRRQSGFTGGGPGTRKNYPASVAVSGAARQFIVPNGTAGQAPTGPSGNNTFLGYALAANTFVPVLSADSADDTGNTLSFAAEYSEGQGYGDQFSGWTGNSSQPLSAASGGQAKVDSTAKDPVNLDAGIGDFDNNGNFQLIRLQTYNAQLQYHLPNHSPNWFTLGYGHLHSFNMDNLVNASFQVPSSGKVAYTASEVEFLNYMHDFTAQIRAGIEYATFTTTYADGTYGHDQRWQASAWFIF